MISITQPSHYLQNINTSLEEKSWFHGEKLVDEDLCKILYDALVANRNPTQISNANIGRGHSKNLDESIRRSFITWIDDWQETVHLDRVNSILNEIMISLNEYFYLSMQRFESQFAVYEIGDFYKLHLDQHQHTKHRQVSCNLYLNDCPEGGELVLYEKNSRTEIAQIIKPKRGSLVLFFSGQIYHEVKCAQNTRYSLTTWFRDDRISTFQSLS